jgi:hypothetical protein
MLVAPDTGLGDEINEIRLQTAEIVTKEITTWESSFRLSP